MKSLEFFRYSREVRYALFVLTIFLIIATIKVYVNNINIDNSINERIFEQVDYKQKEHFQKNFYIPYLSWYYWKYFISHENNITFSWENIIKFTQLDKQQIGSWVVLTWNKNLTWNSSIQIWTWDILKHILNEENIVNISNPSDSWNHFLKNRYAKFLELFNIEE